ncbi:putative alcohol dehydrogenase [Lupinus albus]|uniref:Putative alcohol dehydrogenase n=1 Tax=Lupinus albus TaxID=3870 RepID=A0A6A4P344_LUPAL|nr:putative alcohol dehydrogenase [Lupinus albus]
MEIKLPTSSEGKPIRCKAVVARNPGEALVIEEIIVAPTKTHEVRVQDPPAFFPRILGHEAIGFSEYTVVDIANVTKIDPEIPPNKACLLTCGIAADMILSFAFEIKQRLKEICEYHMHIHEFNFFTNCLQNYTGGVADYCFESVGIESLVHEAYGSCRKGWMKTIVLGLCKPGARLSLSSSEVLHDGKTLMGALFGELKPKSHVPILLKRYVNKNCSYEVEFKDVNKAFDLLKNEKCLQCVIWMDK